MMHFDKVTTSLGSVELRTALFCEGSMSAETALVSRWEDFVDPKKRAVTMEPFLSQFVKGRNEFVLDAATGLGLEATYMARKGCRVVGNEIDPAFRRRASNRACEAGVNVRLEAVDWRDLSQHFPINSVDVFLLLGNSLCLLRDRAGLLEAAKNFRAVCRQGGVLLVDQRNFDYIWASRESILRGRFRYSDRVIYCGSKVRARPVTIQPDIIQFTYEDSLTGNPLWHMDMYPFFHGELVRLFEQAGFVFNGIFSDLKPGFRADADFYTYNFR